MWVGCLYAPNITWYLLLCNWLCRVIMLRASKTACLARSFSSLHQSTSSLWWCFSLRPRLSTLLGLRFVKLRAVSVARCFQSADWIYGGLTHRRTSLAFPAIRLPSVIKRLLHHNKLTGYFLFLQMHHFYFTLFVISVQQALEYWKYILRFWLYLHWAIPPSGV